MFWLYVYSSPYILSIIRNLDYSYFLLPATCNCFVVTSDVKQKKSFFYERQFKKK